MYLYVILLFFVIFNQCQRSTDYRITEVERILFPFDLHKNETKKIYTNYRMYTFLLDTYYIEVFRVIDDLMSKSYLFFISIHLSRKYLYLVFCI